MSIFFLQRRAPVCRTIHKRLLIVLFLFAWSGFAGASPGGDCCEVWKMRHLFVTAVAGVEREGNTVRGVARVHGLNGKTDVYHFSGTVQEDRIEASHSDGHFFRGKFVSPEEISGILTTKTGLRLDIRAERSKQVPPSVSADGDCGGESP